MSDNFETRGYIKLWRAICDSELYFSEKFTKSQAWIDLLLLANHKQNTVFVRGIAVELEPGEVLAGEEYLAKRWKWSREKVRNFLSLLSSETRQQIIRKKSNVCSVVVIANWHLYQQNRTADRTTEKQQTGQQKNTPKNVKKGKNISSTPGGFPHDLFQKFRTAHSDCSNIHDFQFQAALSAFPGADIAEAVGAFERHVAGAVKVPFPIRELEKYLRRSTGGNKTPSSQSPKKPTWEEA